MRSPTARRAVVFVLAALGGCGSSNPPPPPAPTVAVVPLATPGVMFNGLYHGQSVLVSGEYPDCPTGRLGNVEIGDQTLLFPYAPGVIFTVPISADGVVHAGSRDQTLDGSIVGTRLAFTVTTPGCRSAYAFDRLEGF